MKKKTEIGIGEATRQPSRKISIGEASRQDIMGVRLPITYQETKIRVAWLLEGASARPFDNLWSDLFLG